MYNNKSNISMLLATMLFASGAFAADAPAADAPAAAPVAAVVAPAAVESAAPAPAPAEAAAAAAPAAVAEAPAAPAEPAVLSEADGLALLKKNGCTVCHSIPKKVVGPAYKDVAAKYRGQDGAEAKLVAKVTKGGKGVWGPIEMPSQAKAGEENIKALVRFVLALKQ